MIICHKLGHKPHWSVLCLLRAVPACDDLYSVVKPPPTLFARIFIEASRPNQYQALRLRLGEHGHVTNCVWNDLCVSLLWLKSRAYSLSVTLALVLTLASNNDSTLSRCPGVMEWLWRPSFELQLKKKLKTFKEEKHKVFQEKGRSVSKVEISNHEEKHLHFKASAHLQLCPPLVSNKITLMEKPKWCGYTREEANCTKKTLKEA